MCVLQMLFSQTPESLDLLIHYRETERSYFLFYVEVYLATRAAVGKTEREKPKRCRISLFVKSVM